MALDALAGLNRQLAASPALNALAGLNRQLAASPALNALAGLNRQLAASPALNALAGLNRQLSTLQMTGLSTNLSRSIDSTLITPPKMEAMAAQRPIRLPNISFGTVRDRRNPEFLSWRDSDHAEVGNLSHCSREVERIAQFDSIVTDKGLRQICRSLFVDGYYDIAVERAYVYVNNMVKEKTRFTDKDGAALMQEVFSAKFPVLRLNAFHSQSDKNEQRGYMNIFAGSMTGIRNPRAHEHDLDDIPEAALERLVLANHLMRMLNHSTLSDSQ